MSEPEPTFEENQSEELFGLDPGELLARGMTTIHPTSGGKAWEPPSPKELARILPQYQIEDMLGAGGMGAVYKGRQVALDRPVAIKILPAEMNDNEQFIARFWREARTLAKLQHPGIVAIYDFGQTSEGHLYFVMEFVEGTDLRRLLRASKLEPEQALDLIGQICDALQTAHRQGVVHRDIKPENILITLDGKVKLADFGLARPITEDTSALTMTNMTMGTPDYMSPEQRNGESDQRSDIYALGIVLYELLTGKRPHGVFDPPSRKVQVDVRIDEVVLKALQEEPERRYQHVSEFKTDVERIRSTPLPLEKHADPTQTPAQKKGQRSFLPFAIAAGLAAAIGGLVVWAPWKQPLKSGALPTAQRTPLATATPALVTPTIPPPVAAPKPFPENAKIAASLPKPSLSSISPVQAIAPPVAPASLSVQNQAHDSSSTGAQVKSTAAKPSPSPQATPAPTPELIPWLLKSKDHWPHEVALINPTSFPVSINGQIKGTIMAPAGTIAHVVNLQPGQVTVEWGQNTNTVPFEATDLIKRGSQELTRAMTAQTSVATTTDASPTQHSDMMTPSTTGQLSSSPQNSTHGGTVSVTEPAYWRNPINLLPLINLNRDIIHGNWQKTADGFVSGPQGAACLEIPYRPPAEYDVRVTFTRLTGSEGVHEILSKPEGSFAWCMGAHNSQNMCFMGIVGRGIDNPSTIRNPIESNRRYTSIISVRNHSVTAYVDGVQVDHLETDGRALDGPFSAFALRQNGLLGIGTFASSTVFHSMEVVEVNGGGSMASLGGGSPTGMQTPTIAERSGTGQPFASPDDLLVHFIAERSAQMFPVGTRKGGIAMQTSDPTAVFRGQPVIFNQHTGTEVHYMVDSPSPLTKLVYRGHTFFNLSIQVLDRSGTPVSNIGPYGGGNVEKTLEIPLPSITHFELVLTSHASDWLLINEIRPEFSKASIGRNEGVPSAGSPAAQNTDTYARLRQIKAIFEQGLINREDYDRKCGEILQGK